MKPLKICFLWHQHQPYYLKDNYFILPWVRFHGVKDYLDLALLLDEYPGIKQTFNIVPSLLLQLRQYTVEGVLDRVFELSYKNPTNLTESEKEEIIHQFFVCNYQNMIEPYERYRELYQMAQNGVSFSEQDWLDLQVWYNLTWVGSITRKQSFFSRLFQKGRIFSPIEKRLLLDSHLEIIKQIVPTLKRLVELGQIELSVSPFYHPILPLLCDVEVAMESMPNLSIPEPKFKFPQDALMQISVGKDFFLQNFGFEPNGLWPSEGSLSTEVLNLIIEADFKWTATDPKLLFNTIGTNEQLLQYFPYRYTKDGKDLVLFFRDSHLSDAIGFVYHNWKPEDAANDFIFQLKKIRDNLVQKFGEDVLDITCVPIILDGENCWEFYPNNGLPFLKELYTRISNETFLVTKTFNEVVLDLPKEHKFVLDKIFPGSWINANFYTWIGQLEKQTAWSYLALVRKEIENFKESEGKYKKALEIALIAEGSDWFWWYGDDNIAPNKSDFDELFRWYLKKIYFSLGLEPPVELNQPISSQNVLQHFFPATKKLTANTLKSPSIELGWGCFNPRSTFGTMQSSSSLITNIFFGNTKDLFAIGLKFARKLTKEDKIIINFVEPVEFFCELTLTEFQVTSTEARKFSKILFLFNSDWVLCFGLDTIFGTKEDYSGLLISFFVKTECEAGEMVYPFSGTITHAII